MKNQDPRESKTNSVPRDLTLGTVPTIVTAHISAHAKVVARDAKEMPNTQDTRSGFVSSNSGRFYLFLVEKMRRF